MSGCIELKELGSLRYHSTDKNRHTMARFHLSLVTAIAIQSVASTMNELSSYNADPNSISVSGFSSGGFMAAQLGIAYSEVFKVGFGVFAGGPYDCARNQYVCGIQKIETQADLWTSTKPASTITLPPSTSHWSICTPGAAIKSIVFAN